MTANRSRIALIGFGEVGSLFARELIATGQHSVATYDILFDAPEGAAMKEKARALKAEPCVSTAAAAKDSLVAISAVTATSAADVAWSVKQICIPRGRSVSTLYGGWSLISYRCRQPKAMPKVTYVNHKASQMLNYPLGQEPAPGAGGTIPLSQLI